MRQEDVKKLIWRRFRDFSFEPSAQFDRASKKTHSQETQDGQQYPISPRQLRFFCATGIRGIRSGRVAKVSVLVANPCEITFMGAHSGVAPSTSNIQRVRPVASSSTLQKPSLA
jgi:hypothetical protein